MRYLVRRVDGERPLWLGNDGVWGDRLDARVFDSGVVALDAVNGGKSVEEWISYLLEVYGGLS